MAVLYWVTNSAKTFLCSSKFREGTTNWFAKQEGMACLS